MNSQKTLNFDTALTLDEVMSAWGRGNYDWRSRREIAGILNRHKNDALVQTLGILVGMGYLATRLVTLPNHVDMFEYAPTAKYAENGFSVRF